MHAPLLDFLNPWNYEPLLMFDPSRLTDLLEKEPLAVAAVAIGLCNLMLMVSLKLFDYWMDARKTHKNRGKVHIELVPIRDACEQLVSVRAFLTNRGNEPIVIREVGFQKKSGLSRSFLPLFSMLDTPEELPVRLNPRELKTYVIRPEQLEQLQSSRFAVRDSLGQVWM